MNTIDHANMLFTPWQLGGLELSNRLAVAPMTRISATPEGMPTEMMARYYARFARGGFGLVITEGIYTDQSYSQGYANQPGLSDLAQAEGWRSVVDAVHTAGGKIVAQLMHAGALSQKNRFRSDAAGPSAVQPKGLQMSIYGGEGPFRLPREMDEAEIAEAVEGFACAARFAIDVAGFDGVEIHGANGYLLDQFLTDYTNLRDDEWGGAIDRRVRLSAEVARAVKRVVGDAVPVGIRISQGKVNDFTHKWAEAEVGAAIVFSTLANVGLDYIHITEFEAWRPAFGDDGQSLVSLARESAPALTILANGGLHEPHRAAQMFSIGTDLIALGRGALANPAWPRQTVDGSAVHSFDPALLSPLGDIKPAELSE